MFTTANDVMVKLGDAKHASFGRLQDRNCVALLAGYFTVRDVFVSSWNDAGSEVLLCLVLNYSQAIEFQPHL